MDPWLPKKSREDKPKDDSDKEPGLLKMNWLGLPDESEEEKQKKLEKKRKKELKKIAKKHARKVVEPDSAELPPDTEPPKVKKRWRRRLQEQSRQKVAELGARAESGELTGYERAQFMVAERLLRLGALLDTPNLAKADKKALKTHIDFMGMLADKLDNPEHTMPEEIEDIYQQVVAPEVSDSEMTGSQKAEHSAPTDSRDASSAEPAPIDQIRPYLPMPDKLLPTPSVADNATVRPSPERSKRASIYGAFVTKLVRAAKTEVADNSRPSQSVSPSSSATVHSSSVSLHPSVEAGVDQRKSVASDISSPRSEFMASAASHSDDRPVSNISRIVTPRTPEKIVQAPIDTPELKTPVSSSNQPIISPSLPSDIRRELEHASTAQMQRAVEKMPTPRVMSPVSAPEKAPIPRVIAPEKPLEALSIGELLKMADQVGLGHGQYLGSAFRKGEIDKNGLMKVLKSHSRGQNHAQEFARQRESFKRLRQSPEFIRQQNNAPAQAASDEANNEASIDKPEPPARLDLGKNPQILDLLSKTKAPKLLPVESSDDTSNSYNTHKTVATILVAATITSFLLYIILR